MSTTVLRVEGLWTGSPRVEEQGGQIRWDATRPPLHWRDMQQTHQGQVSVSTCRPHEYFTMRGLASTHLRSAVFQTGAVVKAKPTDIFSFSRSMPPPSRPGSPLCAAESYLQRGLQVGEGSGESSGEPSGVAS